jgi:AcrR family transcriptional regulator
MPMPTPARTSLGEIVAAGRAIVEADGLDALTMSSVASKVGVRPPSLYKRVRGREELARLVVEDVAREAAATIEGATGSGDATRDLAAVATAIRAFAKGHPRTYGLLFGRPPAAAQPELATLARANDALLSVARDLAGPERALEAARTIVSWAHGFVSMELAGAFRLGGDVDAAFDYGIDRLARALAAAR